MEIISSQLKSTFDLIRGSLELTSKANDNFQNIKGQSLEVLQSSIDVSSKNNLISNQIDDVESILKNLADHSKKHVESATEAYVKIDDISKSASGLSIHSKELNNSLNEVQLTYKNLSKHTDMIKASAESNNNNTEYLINSVSKFTLPE